MTMPALPVISSSQPPAEAPARGADTAATTDAPAFSNVLSQQRDGAARPAQSPQAEHTEHTGPRADAEPAQSREPLGPDETLSLILDSAALPLMQPAVTDTARPVQTGTTGRGDTADARAPRLVLDIQAAPAQDADAKDRTDARTLLPQDGERTAHRGAADLALNPRQALTADPDAPATLQDAPHPRTVAAHQSHAPLRPLTNQPLDRAGLDALHPLPQTQAGQSVHMTASAATLAPDAALASAAAPAGASLIQTAAPAQAAIPVPLATPLSHPQWPQDFSRQITQLAQNLTNGGHTVQMHVNPPELGPIRITLHVGDSIAQASFVSPHASVRQTLENALPHLAQQLAEAGLSLGQADVGDQQPGQQAQAQNQSAPGRDSESTFSLDGQMADAPPLPATPAAPRSPVRPDALVDTFA